MAKEDFLRYIWETLSKLTLNYNGDVDTLPQNMALDILKILSWRNLRTAGAGRTFWFPLKQIIRPSMWEDVYYMQKKRTSLSQKMEGHEMNLSKQVLLSSPQFTTLSSYPFLSYCFSLPLFIKPNIKMPRFNCFSSLHFPPCYIKFRI